MTLVGSNNRNILSQALVEGSAPVFILFTFLAVDHDRRKRLDLVSTFQNRSEVERFPRIENVVIIAYTELHTEHLPLQAELFIVYIQLSFIGSLREGSGAHRQAHQGN